jgi:hypothetical protein
MVEFICATLPGCDSAARATNILSRPEVRRDFAR